MGLLSTEVEIILSVENVARYEKLGYKIPKRTGKKGRPVLDETVPIIVKVEHLPKSSFIKVDVECDYCNDKYKIGYFSYVKSQRYHEGKVYCRHCIQKVTKKFLESDERDRRKFYPEYTTFIRRVQKRDNYTCQCCKKKNKELEIHHLDGYDWCIEGRLDDTNAITLCNNCHKNFHAKYGYGGNTRKQFQEWFGDVFLELQLFNGDLSPCRKVYCYEENIIYLGASDFCEKHNIKHTSWSYRVLNDSSSGKRINKMHIFWYDEFIKFTPEEIEEKVNKKPQRNSLMVIHLESEKVYDSIKDACKKTGANAECIRLCCHHKATYTKLKDGTKSHWMFYDEFLKNKKGDVFYEGNDF